MNTLHGFVSTVPYAYAGCAFMQILAPLLGLKMKRVLQALLSSSKIMEACKFSVFVAAFNALYKAALCIARRILLRLWRQGDDATSAVKSMINGRSAIVAGFVSGFALMIDAKYRRQFLAVAAMSRMIDTGLNYAQQ